MSERMSSGESLLVKIGSQMCNSVETCHNFSTFLCWKLHALGLVLHNWAVCLQDALLLVWFGLLGRHMRFRVW